MVLSILEKRLYCLAQVLEPFPAPEEHIHPGHLGRLTGGSMFLWNCDWKDETLVLETIWSNMKPYILCNIRVNKDNYYEQRRYCALLRHWSIECTANKLYR